LNAVQEHGLQYWILNPVSMPKSSRFRKKFSKILEYCEMCKIGLGELHENKIMLKKFSKSFKAMYLFDVMKSGYIKKVSSILTSNPLI
jgi:hypothetical protein